MRVIRPVLVADVVAALAAGRDLRSGSAPWTLRFLEQAERQFQGQWHEVELTGDEALATVLPPHRGEPCKGDRLTLVPAGGQTVAVAARALDGQREAYARDNPTCWSRVAEAAGAPFSPVILTTAALVLPEYADLEPHPGAIFHLDGFHRLIGWALAARLTSDARVRAFVAGLR